jgi:ferredoxin
LEKLYLIDLENMRNLINSLAKEKKLFAPVSNGGPSGFSNVLSYDDARLDLINVLKSPKFQLLPQTEEMFSYDMRSGRLYEKPLTKSDTVFFGVRPCDASAINVLDSVIMSGKFEDPYYSSRRQSSLIISVACERFSPTCFCKDMGTGPVEGTGGDISLLRDSDKFYAKPTSPKGLGLIKLHPNLFREASSTESNSYFRKRYEIESAMPSRLDVKHLAQKLKDAYEDQSWFKLSESCIGCALCSFFCPTCYCFDVLDCRIGASCKRLRGWDSCLFRDFSKMAGGLDPRPTNDMRFRHRIFHKSLYVPETFGVSACVGCGRCVSLCPANIDVREVLSAWE